MLENISMGSANIKNKSNHPVEIKKINTSLWTLRDEIEACIKERMSTGQDESVIEEIKEFYQSLGPQKNDNEGQIQNEVSSNEETQKAKFQRSIPNEVISGFSFLADINMQDILVFSKERFTHGQTIIIRFDIPKTFTVSAEVIKTADIGRNSKIISDTKPQYRVLAKFINLFENEQNDLREFLYSIEPTRPTPAKKLKLPSQMSDGDMEEEDDDEFGDLDL